MTSEAGVCITQEVRGQRIKADCRVSDVSENMAASADEISPNQEEIRPEQ